MTVPHNRTRLTRTICHAVLLLYCVLPSYARLVITSFSRDTMPDIFPRSGVACDRRAHATSDTGVWPLALLFAYVDLLRLTPYFTRVSTRTRALRRLLFTAAALRVTVLCAYDRNIAAQQHALIHIDLPLVRFSQLARDTPA